MTDPIKLARECGAAIIDGDRLPPPRIDGDYRAVFTPEQLVLYTARVRAEAFEEAAKVCDAQAAEWGNDAVVTSKNYAWYSAQAIRALIPEGGK